MSSEFDRFFNDFRDKLRELIRETVAEEVEPIRHLLLRPAGEQPIDVEELVDAEEVARLLGEDLSTPARKRAALNRVYELARRKLIPSVRISPRRVRFNPAAVKKALAQGGLAEPYRGNVSPLQRRAS